MRIVSGRLKSRQISLPKLSTVRPTTDKLRSAIFSILADKVVDANFLDVFAGSGAVGIEALSRGAKFVQFIDNNLEAIELNKHLIADKDFNILRKDILKVMRIDENKYDIVFIDPPYGKYDTATIMKKIIDNFSLKDDAVIVYEEFFKSEFNLVDGYFLDDERRFGDTVIRFIKKA